MAKKTKTAAKLSLSLNLQQIQGNILDGFNKDYQAFLFLRVVDRERARSWLQTIISEVATADEVQDFARQFKKVNRRRGGELGVLKATWMNIAFTFSGLQELGAPGGDQFPEAFRQGKRARAQALGDVGPSAPENWVPPFRDSGIHALMIVASDSERDLGEHVLRYLHNLGVNGGVQVAYLQDGAVREDEPGHEHFGFRDGVSQPGIRHLDAHVPGAEPIQANPGQDRLHAGEFVLGYPTQLPFDKVCPNGSKVAPNPDEGPISPKHKGPDQGDGDETAPEWAVNGSYLVFRRLAQDVGRFRNQLARLAREKNVTVEQIGAKLVGRYASGAPLELTEDEKDLIGAGKLPKTFDPTAGDPSAAVAQALGIPPSEKTNRGNLAEDSRLDNHFEYQDDDPDGKTVPAPPTSARPTRATSRRRGAGRATRKPTGSCAAASRSARRSGPASAPPATPASPASRSPATAGCSSSPTKAASSGSLNSSSGTGFTTRTSPRAGTARTRSLPRRPRGTSPCRRPTATTGRGPTCG